jgi:cell division protein FtsN
MKLTDILYESVVNLYEDQQIVIQQETEEFNQKTGERLTPEQYESVMGCTNPNQEPALNVDQKGKQDIATLRQKMKTATLPELLQLKKQLRDLKKQKPQNVQQQPVAEQIPAPAVITLLGVSMSPAVAIVAGVGLLWLCLFLLGRLIHPRTTVRRYTCRKPDRSG